MEIPGSHLTLRHVLVNTYITAICRKAWKTYHSSISKISSSLWTTDTSIFVPISDTSTPRTCLQCVGSTFEEGHWEAWKHSKIWVEVTALYYEDLLELANVPTLAVRRKFLPVLQHGLATFHRVTPHVDCIRFVNHTSMVQPFPHSNFYSNSFFPSTTRLWNNLPAWGCLYYYLFNCFQACCIKFKYINLELSCLYCILIGYWFILA